jgi:hypothetical protein
MNNIVGQKWLDEIDADEDINTFVESRLLNSKLCSADFSTGKLRDVNTKRYAL